MKSVLSKLGMLLAMLLAFSDANAYDFVVDGIYYKITSMADLEVEVSSNENFQYDSSLGWINTTTYSGKLSIPSTVNFNNRTFSVVGLGKAAFGHPGFDHSSKPAYSYARDWGIPTSVTSVILPSSLRYIDAMAFQGCKIESIELPASLKEIGLAAFAYTSLKEIIIPSGVETIQKQAFYGSNITSVVLGQKVSTVGLEAFQKCSKLMEVFCTSDVLPNGLSTITFQESHTALEIYVPSKEVYGFGREYLSFSKNTYDYTGQSHNIEWTNNLKAYKCSIQEKDSRTDVNAGQYTKELKATYSNGVDFSVGIPYKYVINKAPMTLKVNDVQREYGEANPAFTCEISGFVNGENEQTLGVTPYFECEATQMSKVGKYRILASLNAQNYNITYNYGTLSVVKAPLTATVSDVSRVYGNQNPEFTLSFTGLKNGESSPEWNIKPTLSTQAGTSSKVGQYAITAYGGDAVNYTVTKYNPGTLTVMKRDLTAKANDYERLYGEDNPQFQVSYVGFVNGDTEKSLVKHPVAECAATKTSNVGNYPIAVTGGEAENYRFIYQEGILKINPLTVGFKEVYNSVTYNDMALSTDSNYFNYIPKIVGPYSENDFWIELWFLDKDNHYPQHHIFSVPSGAYEGNYVKTNLDRPMYVGRYIFNLMSKGTNHNVIVKSSRAYLTVNQASTYFEWNTPSPISVKVGETIDLGISYHANLYCKFNTNYNKDLISLSSKGTNSNNPHWYVTGKEVGETTLSFSITCLKNELGFYDFFDTPTIPKIIKVSPNGGVDGISDDETNSIVVKDGTIHIVNKDSKTIVRVFTIQGTKVTETTKEEIRNLSSGLYIVCVGPKSYKVKI